ncbi:diguanylate cyclase [Aliivibrio salmonicida]|uniref:diguanylate cyclase n=1 Tax=Aliivibrio salmonicida (strain LFI1238) TaxID=316275 RepID=B6ESL4_ALISL|nr:GGDEF domain-containing protein [Aliivibrio salmonicida]AZL87000.1 diguanylate cyclase [Aliivibrio salmonicida]CAQ81705.1 membrane associated GGDEF protein [Aliivibrio salmonicida LFI1238]
MRKIMDNTYLKVFLFLFLLYFCILYQYNKLEANSFRMEFHEKITKLYDTVRKITPFYLNTTMIDLNKGTYVRDNVSIMVDEDSKVKKLSSGINLLEAELRNYIGDDYWSIAILERLESNINIAHFKPLHEVHVRLNSKEVSDLSWIDRILDNENMSKGYQAFAQCDLKLTEPYIEQFTGKNVRSIFYPIYENKKLRAIFLLDMKVGVFSNWLNDFNKKRYSFLNYDSDHVLSLSSDLIDIPCTPISNKIILSINMVSLLMLSLGVSFVVTCVLFLIKSSLYRFLYYYRLDNMTGLYLRDFQEEKLNRTSGKSIIIIDIDNFKAINDQYGHFHGDLVIKEVCHRIKKHVRRGDMAIRWGGEEFIIVLNHISDSELLKRAEAIRRSIDVKPIARICVSVSIGATMGKKMSFKKAFKIADTALYQSKNSGRNRVTVLEDVI